MIGIETSVRKARIVRKRLELLSFVGVITLVPLSMYLIGLLRLPRFSFVLVFILAKIVVAYWWFFSDVESAHHGILLAILAGAISFTIVNIEAYFSGDTSSLPIASAAGVGIAYFIKYRYLRDKGDVRNNRDKLEE